MKYITDPKYSKILKLLQSASIEDVEIGAELLNRCNFTDEELLELLPGCMANDPRRDIASKLPLSASINIKIGKELWLHANSSWICISKTPG